MNAYIHRYTNRTGNEYTLTKLEPHYADIVVESFTHTSGELLTVSLSMPIEAYDEIVQHLDV